jgi:hypothetical protein
MQELPNVEVSRLPVLIEVRLEQSLQPAEVRKARDQIAAEPEIETVIFNENGLEEWTSFARNVTWYTHAFGGWFKLLLLISIAACAWHFTRYRAWPAAFAASLLTAMVSAVIAWYALHAIAGRPAAHNAFPNISFFSGLARLLLAGTLWVAIAVLATMWRTRRQLEVR